MPAHIDKSIGVGILGAGRPNIATSQHLPACEECPRVRLVALCDRDPGVEAYAARAGVKAYRDFDALLGDAEVEMVQVATPDWCHCEHALRALAAGKAVLLQKPPCVNRHELELLRRAAAAHPGRLKVCLNNRETRRSRRLRELIAAGEIGEVVHIRIAYRGRRFPIHDPASPYRTAALGGVWIHNGLHWLDEACLYAGALPDRVQAFTTRNAEGPPEVLGEGPNYWSARFEFGSAITFHFEYNTMLLDEGMPGGIQRVVVGTEGEIRLPYGSDTLEIYRRDAETARTEVLYADAVAAAADVRRSFVRVTDAFACQVLDGRERPPAIAHSLDGMEWLFAAAESAERLQVMP